MPNGPPAQRRPAIPAHALQRTRLTTASCHSQPEIQVGCCRLAQDPTPVQRASHLPETGRQLHTLSARIRIHWAGSLVCTLFGPDSALNRLGRIPLAEGLDPDAVSTDKYRTALPRLEWTNHSTTLPRGAWTPLEPLEASLETLGPVPQASARAPPTALSPPQPQPDILQATSCTCLV